MPGLASMGMVEATATRDGTPGTVRRYHLPSAGRTAEPFSPAVRAHWRIATSLHRAPDVGFDADPARKSCSHAAENLATPRKLARKLARNLPRSARPDISLRRGPKRAGWSDAFARSVRGQMRSPCRTRNCRLHAIAPARMLRRSAATARPQWQAQEC
jgi:hypothetical protein